MAYPQKLERDADASVKEAVRVLHQGLSVLAGQITATENNSAHVAAQLTGNWEQMARRLSEMRAELNESRRTLDDRLSASEKTAHYNSSTLEHALDRIEAFAIQRAMDQAEFQRQAAVHEQLLERLNDTCLRLEKRLPDSNLVHRLEAVERAIAGLTVQTKPDQSSSPALEVLPHRLEQPEDEHVALPSELRGGAVGAVPQADEGTSRSEPPAPEPHEIDLTAASDLEDLFTRPQSVPVNFPSSARALADPAPDASRPRFLFPVSVGLVALLMLAGGIMLHQQPGPKPAIRPPAALHIYSIAPARKAEVTPAKAVFRDSMDGPQPANRHGPSPDRVQALATQGNSLALTILGLRAADGTGGVAVNLPDAFKYLRQAAEKGQAVAQFRLGSMYEHGQGVASDPVKAAHWYELSAVQGNRKAMHNLAVYYAATQDMADSARWFAKAAGLGLPDSQFNLAILYERGEGVPQSLADAFKWYSIAAASGDAESRARLVLLQNQLSDADKAAAIKAALAFRRFPINRAANVPPEAGELPSG